MKSARVVKSTPSGLTAKLESMLDEIKALHSENEKLKSKLANDSLWRCHEPGTGS